MHPILSDSRKLISYLLVWLLIGALIARFINLADLASLNVALLFALPVTIVFGFVAGSAYYVCRALPISGRKIFPTIALFLFASLLSGVIWLGLCVIWNNLAAAVGWWSIAFSDNGKSLLFSAGCGCYLISMLFHDLLLAAERVRNAELQTARSQVIAQEAQLQMLRAQINPHFLFNSLNSISALTGFDATAARSMTIALAQFFRQSLALSEKTSIALGEEIELCERFLEVEKIRFGSKLQSRFEADDKARSAQVPPMLLQPLIENAIKHGIRDLPGGGVIRIACLVRDAWLHITVENPCQASPSSSIGNGMGLVNIKQRMLGIYGNQSRFQWHRQEQIFCVEITLPLKIET